MKTSHDAPTMPFQVDHSLRVKIATQVTDGLRTAILTGFYKPGDILPTILEFTHGLHVSIRAPQAAFRTLKREGLISPRQRLGTVVVGPEPGVFHGRIVIAETDYSPVFNNSVIADRLGHRLADAGYLVARVARAGSERFDVRQFDAALRQNTDLAVIIASPRYLADVAQERGVPLFVVGKYDLAMPDCIGVAQIDTGCVLPKVIARLREKSATRLALFSLRLGDRLDFEALHTVCGTVEHVVVREEGNPDPKLEDIVRMSYDLFLSRYRTKADLPDAFLFADDYIARGALLALLAAGFRTGRDVHVITLANRGITLLHPDPIDLLLIDPVRNADIMADALLAYLRTGQRPGNLALETTFVAAPCGAATSDKRLRRSDE